MPAVHSLTPLGPGAISLEARMVLKTLEQKPMSISALERHWRPTWSIDEVRAIVTQLQRQNLIQFTDRVLERGHYVAQAYPTALKKAAHASTAIRS